MTKIESLFLGTLLVFYACSIFMAVFYFVTKVMGHVLLTVVH